MFWVFGKKLWNAKPSILPLSAQGPVVSSSWWLSCALWGSSEVLHSVSWILLVPAPWLACWVGLSNSTWRLWPTSTWATRRSSTVWTSWSTWRVSTVVGGTANSVGLLGPECDVGSRREDTCCSYWCFIPMVCVFVPTDGFSSIGPHVFPWQLLLWQALPVSGKKSSIQATSGEEFYLSISVKMSDFSFFFFLPLKFG